METKARGRRVRPPGDARFGLADNAWLNMERPNNHFVVTGLMRFDRRLDIERLTALYEERLAGYPRFRQCVEPSRLPFGLPNWRADPSFEMRRHIKVIELPDREGVLQDYMAGVISRPLDPRLPLWELHVINGPGPGCVLLSRIHHCIGDGMALLNVLMSLTDEGSRERARRRRTRRGPLTALTPVLAEVGRLALDGGHRRDSAVYLASAAGRLLHLTLMPFDPPNPFKGALAPGKRLAWLPPLPMEQARAIGELAGATINDVVLSCATAAMAAYMRDRGVQPLPPLRATVTYNLRSYENAIRLGNGFTLVWLPLALEHGDPLLRLAETSERMREIKRSPEPMVTNLVLNTVGLLPPRLEDLAVRFFGAKASAVMTNVPGPRRALHLDGVPIREIRFWEPQSASISIGWSVFSYTGRLFVSAIVDAGLVPDPGRLTAEFEKEFGELAALAGVARRRQRRIGDGNRNAQAKGKARRPGRGRPPAEQRPAQRSGGRGSGRADVGAPHQVRGRRGREGAAEGAPERAPRDQARADAGAPAPRVGDRARARSRAQPRAPRAG